MYTTDVGLKNVQDTSFRPVNLQTLGSKVLFSKLKVLRIAPWGIKIEQGNVYFTGDKTEANRPVKGR